MSDAFDAKLEEITRRFEAKAAALRSKVEGLGPLGVIELWERGAIDQDDFDSVFWDLWCQRVDAAGGIASLPLPVRHYFASRLLEWEVGNGGFAQAVHNVPEMFEPAAAGYDALDLPRCAERIRECIRIMGMNARQVDRWRRIRSIGRLFRAFAGSPFRRLDAGLDKIGWWAEDARLAYVRSNKASFTDPEERRES